MGKTNIVKHEYRKIKQGKVINEIAKMTPRNKQDADLFSWGDAALESENGVVIKLCNVTHQLPFKISTHKLFDCLLLKLAELNSVSISFTVEEYAALLGIKGIGEARKSLLQDLETLDHLSVKMEEKDENPLSIIAHKEIHRGVVLVKFAEPFFKMVNSYTVMDYPLSMLQLNAHNNPNSYYFARKLILHNNINHEKSNRGILNISSIINSSPALPRYDDVIKKDQHVLQRIMRPFIRDMRALKGFISYQYKVGESEITEEQLENLKYYTFQNVRVHFTLIDCPVWLPTQKKKGKVRVTDVVK